MSEFHSQSLDFFARFRELLNSAAIAATQNKMDSHELMQLLIPDAKVKEVSEFTGLTTSLLYMERRSSGKKLTDTGTRNTIDRLDLFCEWILSKNPDAVRLVGERYARMYAHHTSPIEGEISIQDLLRTLGVAGQECGQAIAALSGSSSVRQCEVEVAQARRALENALAMVIALEEQN